MRALCVPGYIIDLLLVLIALTGILSAMTAPLRVAKVPIFVVSTWFVLLFFGRARHLQRFTQEHRLASCQLIQSRGSGQFPQGRRLDVQRLNILQNSLVFAIFKFPPGLWP